MKMPYDNDYYSSSLYVKIKMKPDVFKNRNFGKRLAERTHSSVGLCHTDQSISCIRAQFGTNLEFVARVNAVFQFHKNV